MKTLSVVIPTYNVEKYLRRCLDSLLYDSTVLEDLELLVVNDGSKDHSLEIAKEYEKKYPKTVVVIDKENGGHGSTINAGLKVAKGKYFRVIDSDDWVNIDQFGEYVRALKKCDTDIVLTNYTEERIYSGEIKEFHYQNIEFNKVYDLNQFDYSSMGKDYFFMATSTYKTEKLRKAQLELDEKTFYVDMEYILLPFLEMQSMMLLDFNIYRYFIGRMDQSINIQSYVRNRSHHEKVAKRLLEFYKQIPNKEPRKAYIHNCLLGLLNTHYIIYCKARLPEKASIQEIIAFDQYLQRQEPNLYLELESHDYIKWNRKTKFRFSQTKNNILSRICDRFENRRTKEGK